MADHSEISRRPLRAPMPSRSRKRWAAVAGVAGLWMLLLVCTHSMLGGTVLLLLVVALAIAVIAALRYLGVNRDHPWVRRAAARPWRDGRDVLQLGLRHLPEVFVTTPSGSLLAPNLVELRMNAADVAALTELMELDVINSSACEVYATKIAAHAACLASAGPVEVSIVADPAVPVGRYRLKQGRRGSLARTTGDVADDVSAPDRDEYGEVPQSGAATLVGDVLTVEAPLPAPLLRLVTNGCVAQTRRSGARAGRGSDAELQLPEEPTVSRVHAEFTFTAGEWRISNVGRNGVLVNDMPVTRECAIHTGDSIRWGHHPGAVVSRVEVG